MSIHRTTDTPDVDCREAELILGERPALISKVCDTRARGKLSTRRPRSIREPVDNIGERMARGQGWAQVDGVHQAGQLNHRGQPPAFPPTDRLVEAGAARIRPVLLRTRGRRDQTYTTDRSRVRYIDEVTLKVNFQDKLRSILLNGPVWYW